MQLIGIEVRVAYLASVSQQNLDWGAVVGLYSLIAPNTVGLGRLNCFDSRSLFPIFRP